MKRLALSFTTAVIVIVTVLTAGCSWFEESLTRGLEEEKSLTRNAMLAYRRDPGAFQHRIWRDQLREWSNMDLTLSRARLIQQPGPWARTTEQIPGVDLAAALNDHTQPYCVVRAGKTTFVLSLAESRKTCRSGLLEDYEVIPYSAQSCVAGELCTARAKKAGAPEIEVLTRD